jgi:hypothetical protein
MDLDLSNGLLLELEVVWKSWTFIQKLDWWKSPSRCSKCRKIGHLRKYCPWGPLKLRRCFSSIPTSVNPSPSVMVLGMDVEETMVKLEIHNMAHMKTRGIVSGQIHSIRCQTSLLEIPVAVVQGMSPIFPSNSKGLGTISGSNKFYPTLSVAPKEVILSKKQTMTRALRVEKTATMVSS